MKSRVPPTSLSPRNVRVGFSPLITSGVLLVLVVGVGLFLARSLTSDIATTGQPIGGAFQRVGTQLNANPIVHDAPKLLWTQAPPVNSSYYEDFRWGGDGAFLASTINRFGGEIDLFSTLEATAPPVFFSAPTVVNDKRSKVSTNGTLTASIYFIQPNPLVALYTLNVRILNGLPAPSVIDIPLALQEPQPATGTYGVLVRPDGKIWAWGYGRVGQSNRTVLFEFNAAGQETAAPVINNFFDYPRGATWNRDGSLLAIQAPLFTRIFTLNSGVVSTQDYYNNPSSANGHLASSDSGDTIVFSQPYGDAPVTILRRSAPGQPFGMAYQFIASPANIGYSVIALSGDGKSLARGTHDQSNPLVTRVTAWNLGLTTQTQILSSTITGTPGQNIDFSDLSFDFMGEKLVTAHTGFHDGSIPQIQIFERTGTAAFSQAPTHTVFLSGSAANVKLNSPGSKLAITNYDGHTDHAGGKPRLSLYGLESDIRATGAVLVGQTITITVDANPGENVTLYRATFQSNPPINMGVQGLRWLANPQEVRQIIANSAGIASFTIPLTGTTYAPGTMHHFQALRNGQNTYTKGVESIVVSQ